MLVYYDSHLDATHYACDVGQHSMQDFVPLLAPLKPILTSQLELELLIDSYDGRILQCFPLVLAEQRHSVKQIFKGQVAVYY